MGVAPVDGNAAWVAAVPQSMPRLSPAMLYVMPLAREGEGGALDGISLWGVGFGDVVAEEAQRYLEERFFVLEAR